MSIGLCDVFVGWIVTDNSIQAVPLPEDVYSLNTVIRILVDLGYYLLDYSFVTESPVAGSTSNGPGRSNSLAISRTAGMTSSPIRRRLRMASS